MCQEFPKEKWIDAQKENVLDAPYYHVVFTVPEELNSIIYSNQKLLYDALYHAASATLNELAKDAKYLGANIGYICILHTWGSAMNYHPHIHTIAPTVGRAICAGDVAEPTARRGHWTVRCVPDMSGAPTAPSPPTVGFAI